MVVVMVVVVFAMRARLGNSSVMCWSLTSRQFDCTQPCRSPRSVLHTRQDTNSANSKDDGHSINAKPNTTTSSEQPASFAFVAVPLHWGEPCKYGYSRNRRQGTRIGESLGADHVASAPLLTMITRVGRFTPKSRIAFHSWALLLPHVEIVVASDDCETLLYASFFGLSTYYTDDSALVWYTYAAYFEVVAMLPSAAPFIGYTSCDVVYDSSLVETLRALVNVLPEGMRTRQGWVGWQDNRLSSTSSHTTTFSPAQAVVMATGRQYDIAATGLAALDAYLKQNYQLPNPHLFPEGDEWRESKHQHYRVQDWASIYKTFISHASISAKESMRYFIVSRGAPMEAVPPGLMIGGPGFAEWFASLPTRMSTGVPVTFVDTSTTVNSLHFTHNKIAESHRFLATEVR